MRQVTWRANADLAVDDEWIGVGQYPTPTSMVDDFVGDLTTFIRKGPAAGLLRKRNILIADIFAGDGRLGVACRDALRECTRASVHTTFIECDPARAIRLNGHRYPGSLVLGNAFVVEPSPKLDVVVANPPYLALNVEKAEKLELKWKDVVESGRNLYGVSIRRAIDFCAPGRVVALIAPFGWIRGHHSRSLRAFIGKNCSEVSIKAYKDRTLFDDAQQDIAFQFFVKRKAGQTGRCDVTFGHESGPSVVTHLPYQRKKKNEPRTSYKVGVGPFVWNRNKRHTRKQRKRGMIPIVYGGNIRAGTLQFNVPKYSKKQFVRSGDVPKGWIGRGPSLLIRRTLRGKPGGWKIDSVIVESPMRFVAENHVIWISGGGLDMAALLRLGRRVVRALRRHVKFVGTPNLTAHKVRDILRRM